MMPRQNSVKNDWLFNNQTRVLQADWLILENNEKAILNVNMSHCGFYDRQVWAGES